jgi:hypothetical protein
LPRALTPAPTDKVYWRKLLRRCHPDHGGSHDLFIWVDALREYVVGNAVEPQPRHVRRAAPQHPTTGDRIDFSAAQGLSFGALAVADEVGEPYAGLLFMLASCEDASESVTLRRTQAVGATYKSVAAVAYRAGLDKEHRQRWYKVCESVPLSQRHIGHIIQHLQGKAA